MVSFVCNFTFQIEISAKMCDCIIIKLLGKETQGIGILKFTFQNIPQASQSYRGFTTEKIRLTLNGLPHIFTSVVLNLLRVLG